MRDKRKCTLGNNDITLKLKHMKDYDLVKVTISFNDYNNFFYKISTVVDNCRDEIEEGITLLLKKAEKKRNEKYTITKDFVNPFKEKE